MRELLSASLYRYAVVPFLLLISTELRAVESTYALYDYHGESCLIETAANDSRLVSYNSAVFNLVLQQDRSIRNCDFIQFCPWELALKGRCTQLNTCSNEIEFFLVELDFCNIPA